MKEGNFRSLRTFLLFVTYRTYRLKYSLQTFYHVVPSFEDKKYVFSTQRIFFIIQIKPQFLQSFFKNIFLWDILPSFFKYDSLLDAYFLSLREIGPHIAVIGCPYKVALLEILRTPPESLEILAKMCWATTNMHFDKNSSVDDINLCT